VHTIAFIWVSFVILDVLIQTLFVSVLADPEAIADELNPLTISHTSLISIVELPGEIHFRHFQACHKEKVSVRISRRRILNFDDIRTPVPEYGACRGCEDPGSKVDNLYSFKW